MLNFGMRACNPPFAHPYPLNHHRTIERHNLPEIQANNVYVVLRVCSAHHHAMAADWLPVQVLCLGTSVLFPVAYQ